MKSRSHPSHGFWKQRQVAVTGHMGFKGAWLCALLARLGARSSGFGQDARTPLLYSGLVLPDHESFNGDINDLPRVSDWLHATQPEFLLHLAAQPIVLQSFEDPIGTFADNIMGTAKVLQAARGVRSLRAIIVITSDKVYRNADDGQAFREEDPLGGKDPYSASKAAAELVTESMARSFYRDSSSPHVVTVRAGNVIGGGDWAEHRLLPDAARAFSAGLQLKVRNPSATRPWQHVLDPLAGYLLLCESLALYPNLSHRAWNFGPDSTDVRHVADVLELFTRTWGQEVQWDVEPPDPDRGEARTLMVDSTLARAELGWRPKWRVDEAICRTAEWYRDYAAGVAPQDLVRRDLEAFLD